MKRTAIEQLLPEIIRRTAGAGSPLAAILDVMEGLHAPSEQLLGRIDQVFNPYATDARFVPWLACWLDLERFFSPAAGDPARPGEPISTGSGRLRELIARAAWLSKWRGTGRGLLAFLETATGATGFALDEQWADGSGAPRPFHVRVRVPGALAPHHALIARIVESEKPAYVTADIIYEDSGAAAAQPEENEHVPRV